MIAHLSYVMCDICGNAAQPVAEGSKVARFVAKSEGYTQVSGRDLCGVCTSSRNAILDGSHGRPPRTEASDDRSC
jgi:hypothetical protein